MPLIMNSLEITKLDKKMIHILHFLKIIIVILFLEGMCYAVNGFSNSIEEIALEYENDKNSMIAIPEREDFYADVDFYDEFDNRMSIEHSMNIIFFGPPSAFMRIDAESILHILAHMKKHLIPITRTLLAWDIITDGKTAAFLQGRELLAFGSLLNYVPEEDLYYLNFGDISVLKYFANNQVDLHSRKYGVLTAAYKRSYGNNWYENSSFINDLGYLLCGFTSLDLEKISPKLFVKINTDVLKKLNKCTYNQTKTLYNIATQPDAYGEPHKWSSHEIGRLGALFACIPKDDISSVPLEAVTAITANVIKLMNQQKLKYFTKLQIMRMNPQTRRIYILRMQLKSSLDMSQIAKSSSLDVSEIAKSSQACVLAVLLFNTNVVTVTLLTMIF